MLPIAKDFSEFLSPDEIGSSLIVRTGKILSSEFGPIDCVAAGIERDGHKCIVSAVKRNGEWKPSFGFVVGDAAEILEPAVNEEIGISVFESAEPPDPAHSESK